MSTASFCDLKDILSKSSLSLDSGDNGVVPMLVKQRAHELCVQFMGGIWKKLNVDEIIVSRMKGGMSNMLFLCEQPKKYKHSNRVLLRVYFNPEIEANLVKESVIFTLLSERKLGPKLYGIFNGGRLEEYIVSRQLTCHEISTDSLSSKIAAELAKIHHLNVPINKEPTYLNEALSRWMMQIMKMISENNNRVLGKPIALSWSNKVKLVSVFDLADELHHCVIKCLNCAESEVRFCHNDLQEGNILLPVGADGIDKLDDDLVLIDFEYASYNYRAFDFANHFCEYTVDYTTPDSPFFTVNIENYPSEANQRKFIQDYLKASNEEYSSESFELLCKETKCFAPVSHFFWGIWSLLQLELSPIDFDFLEYAKQRLGLYFELKPDLLTLLNNNKEGHCDVVTNGNGN